MDGGVETLHGARPEKVPMTPIRLALRTDLEKKHHELTELGKPPVVRKPGKYFRILAIDGGGVRGIIPALVIKYIEERTGKKIPDLFNLVAGTSTGALLGVVLSIPGKDRKKPGYTSNDTMGLYITECPRIFKTSLLQRIKNMGGLADAKYPAAIKRKVVKKYAGSLRISDCLTDILIPSFDMREGVPYFFKSTMAREDPKYDYRIADILDATSAAPTYFRPCKVEGQDALPELGYRCFIDGAVTANCPALAAALEAIKVYGVQPDDIVVVSIGCGDADIGRTYQEASNMGALGWATYIPSALISGSIYSVEQQADQMLNDTSYWRFQTRVPYKHSSIDDASPQNLLWLKRAGKELVRCEKERLDQLCDILTEGLN